MYYKIDDFNKCSKEKWENAQKFEENVWLNSPRDYEDYNTWWAKQFEEYKFLTGIPAPNIIEVGCGPYAKNTRLVLRSIDTHPSQVDLLDPLLDSYIENSFSVTNFTSNTSYDICVEGFSIPLEDFQTEKKYNIVICINVLDHVLDVEKCFKVMYDILDIGGVLILGQDLTNEEDFKLCPQTITDIGHPIKVHHEYIRQFIKDYKHIFQKILPREEGRNPAAHYGTLLYAGVKQ